MYDRTNTGTLNKNLDKQNPGANPNWPDYKGKININGQDHWLSAWIKQGKSGEGSFMSLSIGDPVQPRQQQASQQKRAASFDDFDQNLPF